MKQPFNLQEQTTEGCRINNYSEKKRCREKQKRDFSRENEVRCGKNHAIFRATNLSPGILKSLVVVL